MLLVVVSVAVALLTCGGASVAAGGRVAVCPASTVRAVFAGKRLCLKGGQACVRRLDVLYQRHGFDCIVGTLIRRSGWAITDIGSNWEPLAVNERGQVVGNWGSPSPPNNYTAPTWRAVLWQNGKRAFLTPTKTFSPARAINDAGQVIGYRVLSTGAFQNFLWQDGVLTDLGGLHPVGLNNRGQVAGNTPIKDSGGTRGLLWDGGVVTDLGALRGATTAAVADETSSAVINDRGQVLVAGSIEGEASIAVWENGTLTSLGTRGLFYAEAINEPGQVILRGYPDDAVEHGFLWDNGVLSDLGSLGGGWTDPRAVNGHAQVVGSTLAATGYHAFLWQDGRMRDLGTLGGKESRAVAINERGQIVGSSDSRSGRTHAFLWQNGRMTDLSPVTALDSGAVALNERGQVVGWVRNHAKGTLEAVLWTLRSSG